MWCFLIFAETKKKNLLEKTVNVNYKNVSLSQLLSQIGERTGINFIVNLEDGDDLNFAEVNLHNRNLKSWLEELSDKFDIHYKIEGNNVYLYSCKKRWEHYKIRFFYEDPLPESLSTLNDNTSNNSGNEKTKSSESKKSLIWEEIEKNLVHMSKDISLNRYNGIASCYGKCKLQKSITKYVKKVNKDLHGQIMINCKVIEIVTINSREIDITKLLDFVNSQSNNNNSFKNYINLIRNFCNSINDMKNNVQIKTSNDVQLLLVSQQTGSIFSTTNRFIKDSQTTTNYNDQNIPGSISRGHIQQQQQTEKEQCFAEGFSMSVVPLIIDDDKFLLKIRPCVLAIQSFDQQMKPIFQRRELLTVIKAKKNQTIILGGLSINTKKIKRNIWNRIPIIKWFVGQNNFYMEKSYILILLKVDN